MNHLPKLTDLELELTHRLAEEIQQEISHSGGSIPLSRYIELALYHKAYGYYNNLLHKFGRQGDFITAPLLSPSFAFALSQQFLELFEPIGRSNLLEIGAGNGQFMLDTLARIGNEIENYYILELSGNLVSLQKANLSKTFPQYRDKVKWLTELPKNFVGVVFINEVLDAQPCDSYTYNKGRVQRVEVTNFNGDKFAYLNKDLPNPYEVLGIINKLPSVVFNDDFLIDINLYNRGFINTLASSLGRAAVIFIDYGYGERECYNINRYRGTIRGFFRHTQLDSILEYPGLIDITSSVDFTAIATTGINCGLDLIDYTTQGAFLLNCGILDYLSNSKPDSLDSYRVRKQISQLTSVNGMGEVFKVIGFSKNLDFEDWLGFKHFSQAHLL